MLAFTEGEMRRPDAIVGNKASSWRETTEGADLVIIAHSDFMNSVAPLRALRESEGLQVTVADLEDVYDEFSYGQRTPQAIKDFLQFARTSWQKAPRFVLFVGDASLDPKNYLGKGRFDFVPTKLIDTEFMETASDDWFADFAGEGLPEMAIGRLPVGTPEEADRIVGKIVSFEQTDSTGGALLVSDRDDEFDFKGASDELRALLPSYMAVEEIQRGWTNDGREKSQLLDSLNRGNRIVNYLGHGSVGVWRGNLLTQADARELANSEDLALFVATTCLNGYFQEPGYDSLAETLMKAEGGACAVWASSGMTGPEEQVEVNKELFRLLFRGTSLERGRSLTLGEAATVAKAAAKDRDVRRTYTLFGDPTMRIR